MAKSSDAYPAAAKTVSATTTTTTTTTTKAVAAPVRATTVGSTSADAVGNSSSKEAKVPRRKPGARECVQISRRFGNQVIPEEYTEILLDYCSRGKVEHLIRMRERLDEHSRFLELQLAGLESLVKERGVYSVVVPVQLHEQAKKADP
jgi:hypothetical protein